MNRLCIREIEINLALVEWFERTKKEGEEINFTAIKNMKRFIHERTACKHVYLQEKDIEEYNGVSF